MNTTLRALINQAERLVRAGGYEEAIALCHAILRRYPRYARCYRVLGEAYLGLAEYEEAAKLFRRVLGVDPEDPIPYAGLGIIFEERGLLEEAIWQLERAFELAPGRDELRSELGRLYERRGSAAYVPFTRASLARLYARSGLWNKAIGELRDLLVREPYRLDLRVTLARTLWRARRREEAAETAQAILDHAPNCLVARLILGTYWQQEGREDEGRALLEGAQELDPENREAVRLLAAESPLPLRIARVEAEAEVPADIADEDEEAMSPWPETGGVLARQSDDAQPGAVAKDRQEAGLGDGQIATLPPELVLGLLPELEGQDSQEPDQETLPVTEHQPAESQVEPAALEEDELPPDHEAQEAAPYEAAGLAPVAATAEGVEGSDEPALLSTVSVLRRQVEASPEDPEARAALARALAENGQLAEALPLYDALAVPASGYLDRILTELEAIAQLYPESRALRELMGDAYTRAGRFHEAMAMYRWLLAQESPSDLTGG
jgi:tetratricopeptide (TPR) repeat protein